MTSLPTAFEGLSVALGDHYSLERELGRGGMATVYLALDLRLHRHVALKVLRPELAATLGNERFLREIEIAARLSHPHILPLHDSGEAGGHLYYAMPYVEGESLRQRLEREGQLPIAEVIAIVRAVASALTYAHQLGIIHRDIKPENILLAKDASGGSAHPLVADFGIARALDVAGGERLTETGLALGTPAYMSPEQAAGGGRLDGRSDIYALGCVAYEMLAGQPPFTGPTAQSILARHAVDPVPPLHTVRATVPQTVERAVERALAKVPADRFATGDEFAQALEAEPKVGERGRRTFTGWRRLVPALALGAAVIGVGARLVYESTSPTVLPSASRLAVLPFLSPAADTGLARLGRDLAATISATLDGVGGIETADRLSIATSTGGKEDLSPADGSALARSLGATSVVRGTLVPAGDQVRLDLGLYGTEGLAPLAQGITVTTHRDSIRTLTDSASLRLLRQVWKRGEPPSPSLAAITTGSISALRAFLDGERAMTEDRWVDAELAYAAAIKEDSTFWLAYWRHSYAKGWKLEQPDSATLSVALAHLPELPEKERLLADVWVQNQREPPTEELLKRAWALTERFPDYWPGWFEYADLLFHVGPLLGHDLRAAREGLEHVLQLNPRLLPAWDHLNSTAIILEDTALFARTMGRLDTLMPPDPAARPGLHIVLPMQLLLMRGGRFDGLLADTVVGHTAWIKSIQDRAWSALWFSSQGRPAAQIELSRRVLAGRPAQAMAALHRKGIALAWVARGAWDSALAAMDAYVGRASELAGLSEEQIGATGASPELAKLDAYRIAVIGGWLGGLDPGLAAARRAAAAQAVARMTSPFRRMELFWLDGLLAAAKRDLIGLREARNQLWQARRQLKEVDSTSNRVLLRSLAAFELELLGRRRQAADSMAAVSWEWGEWVGPYSFGISRLAAARWLAAERDLDQAARLLPWHQAMILSVSFGHGVVVLDGLSYLEMARVEAARGNQNLAGEYYQRFLQRYDSPSPRMRHLVDEARAAVRRLE